MKIPNLKTGEFFIVDPEKEEGIYKGIGDFSYFSGDILNGKPASSGHWFKKKADAVNYIEADPIERPYHIK